MKRATGKLRAHRSLALAARRAAGAFCRRRLKPTLAARARLWTPAVLRWARKRGGARASASRRYSASTVAWTSHFHLHFAFATPFRVASSSGRAHARGSARGLQMPRPSLRFPSRSGYRTARSLPEPTRGAQAQAAGEARNEPTKVQRHLADGFGTRLPAAMRCADGVDRVDHVGHSASAVHPPLGSRRRLHPIVQGHLARSIGVPQSTRLFAQARPRSPSLSRASPGQSLRQDTRALSLNSVLRPARDTTQIRRPIRRIWRARRAEDTVVHASPRLQALAMKREVDLVWRSNTAAAAATVDNLTRSATTFASSVSGARSAPAAALTPPGRNVDKTIVGASALDPALADRLADDVIRRIDRRARIERERWGQ
jgi:hypothetical protein